MKGTIANIRLEEYTCALRWQQIEGRMQRLATTIIQKVAIAIDQAPR